MKAAVNINIEVEPRDAFFRFSAKINGIQVVREDAREDDLLIHFLNEDLELSGSKFSCGIGACAACKVAVRVPGSNEWIEVLSCYARLAAVNGMEILTVEGLSVNSELHPLQREFLNSHAFQCGFSTPGFLMAGFIFIDQIRRSPIRKDDLEVAVRSAVSGHICRCTGYNRYVNSIVNVVNRMAESGEIRFLDVIQSPARDNVKFTILKKSQNDSRDKIVTGEFLSPQHRIGWYPNEIEATTLYFEVNFHNIRTGVRIRDFNLRQFLLRPYKSARFVSRTVKEEGRSYDPSSTSLLRVFGDLELLAPNGSISCAKEFFMYLRKSGDCLELKSVSAISLNLNDFQLPLTEFAREFGLKLDGVVEVSFEFSIDISNDAIS